MVTVMPLTVTGSVLERVTERTRTSIFRVVQFDRLRFHSFCISHIYTSLNHKRLVYIPYYIIGFASSGTSTLAVKCGGLLEGGGDMKCKSSSSSRRITCFDKIYERMS